VSSDRPIWRVGSHFPIHVYEQRLVVDDRPVATFHDPKDAALAVEAVNQYSVNLEDQIAGEVERRVQGVKDAYRQDLTNLQAQHRRDEADLRVRLERQCITIRGLHEAMTAISNTAAPHAHVGEPAPNPSQPF
jgi:hypothetical protein